MAHGLAETDACNVGDSGSELAGEGSSDGAGPEPWPHRGTDGAIRHGKVAEIDGLVEATRCAVALRERLIDSAAKEQPGCIVPYLLTVGITAEWSRGVIGKGI